MLQRKVGVLFPASGSRPHPSLRMGLLTPKDRRLVIGGFCSKSERNGRNRGLVQLSSAPLRSAGRRHCGMSSAKGNEAECDTARNALTRLDPERC
jgi:hypothetical protein